MIENYFKICQKCNDNFFNKYIIYFVFKRIWFLVFLIYILYIYIYIYIYIYMYIQERKLTSQEADNEQNKLVNELQGIDKGIKPVKKYLF